MTLSLSHHLKLATEKTAAAAAELALRGANQVGAVKGPRQLLQAPAASQQNFTKLKTDRLSVGGFEPQKHSQKSSPKYDCRFSFLMDVIVWMDGFALWFIKIIQL